MTPTELDRSFICDIPKRNECRKVSRFECLVKITYALTEKFPQKEIFGLTSQMRRAAVSVAANIAEGSKRTSNKDKIHFHTISAGSLEELKYFFILSCDLNFISETERESALEIARHTSAML